MSEVQACKSFSPAVIMGGRGSVNKELLVKRNAKGEAVQETGSDGRIRNVMMPQLDLYAVYGIVTGSKVRSSKFGENNLYIGDFHAINLDSGQEFSANQMYAPGILDVKLSPKLAQAGASGFEFAVVVGIKPDSSSAVGYVYYMTETKKIAEHDAIAKLSAELQGKLPSIRNAKKAGAK